MQNNTFAIGAYLCAKKGRYTILNLALKLKNVNSLPVCGITPEILNTLLSFLMLRINIFPYFNFSINI